jgi:hypothetical protein
MSDHTVTWDQLRDLVGVREPVRIPPPARRWTDEEWAVISRQRERYDLNSYWLVFVDGVRLFLHDPKSGQSIFEARFARGSNDWAISELLVCGNRDVYPRRASTEESDRAEYLIDLCALGVRGPKAPPVSTAVQELLNSVATGDPPLPVSDRMRAERLAASQSSKDNTASQTAPGGAPTPGHSPTGGTVPGACLLCRYTIPAIKTPIGKVDVAIGLCQKCNSLSCGSHGERTSTPAFLCILCDKNLKASSAGWKKFVSSGGLAKLPGRGGTPSAPAAGLSYALASLFAEPDDTPSPLVVQNLEEWTAARPDYQQLTVALMESVGDAVQVINAFLGFGPTFDQPEATGLPEDYVVEETEPPSETAGALPGGYGIGDIRSLWAGIGADGRRLLTSALLLVVVLDLPDAEMPVPVAAIAAALGGALRERFSSGIESIRGRVLDRQFYRPSG